MGKARKEAVSVVGKWKDREVLKRLEWTDYPEVGKKNLIVIMRVRMQMLMI